MIDHDEGIGEFCPGCGIELTINNAGGYRCYCETCVKAMPQFPSGGGGYYIDGKYPDFQWVPALVIDEQCMELNRKFGLLI